MKTVLLSALILLLALFGGILAYTNPLITVGLVAAGWVTIGLALFCKPAPVWPALWPYGLAVLISFVANLDILEAAGARMWLLAAAVGLLFVSGRWVTGEQLQAALWWAGWGVGLLLLVDDNRNILAFWPMVFAVAAYRNQSRLRWPYLALQLLMLFYLGSRGAVLGLIAGVGLYYHSLAYGAGVVTALGILIVNRPETALNRLHYWGEAWTAFLAKPLFGVGPGGLWARSLISEPGGGVQVHAHNFIISSGAELGLVGLAAFLGGAFTIYHLRLTIMPWQIAILAAIVGHSLVDEPLFWPGPLLLAALVVGTIKHQNPKGL